MTQNNVIMFINFGYITLQQLTTDLRMPLCWITLNFMIIEISFHSLIVEKYIFYQAFSESPYFSSIAVVLISHFVYSWIQLSQNFVFYILKKKKIL